MNKTNTFQCALLRQAVGWEDSCKWFAGRMRQLLWQVCLVVV